MKASSMRVSRIGCLASIVISVVLSVILDLEPDHLVGGYHPEDCIGSITADFISTSTTAAAGRPILH
jgi:hypothetical protein